MHQYSNKPTTIEEIKEEESKKRRWRGPSADDVDCVSVGDCRREEYDDDDADCFCD